MTTVIDTAGSPFDAFGLPDVNDSGTVVFYGLDFAPGGVDGVYTHDGATLTPVVGLSPGLTPLNNANWSPGINNQGTVAFVAATPTVPQGLFVGTDPVNDLVVGFGSTLFGRSVSALTFYKGINDRGQLAFLAAFRDGSSGIYRADPALGTAPLAEPPSVALLVLAFVMTGIRRRRAGTPARAR